MMEYEMVRARQDEIRRSVERARLAIEARRARGPRRTLRVAVATGLARLKSIRNVANIVVPESLAGALAAIPMKNVANVVPVPDGAVVNAHVGALTMDGAALAAHGERPTVLLVTGALVITSPVQRVGIHSILTVGAVVAPEGSEAALTPALRRTVGRVAYYPWVEGQAVRVFQGDTRVK